MTTKSKGYGERRRQEKQYKEDERQKGSKLGNEKMGEQ